MFKVQLGPFNGQKERARKRIYLAQFRTHRVGIEDPHAELRTRGGAFCTRISSLPFLIVVNGSGMVLFGRCLA